MRNPKDTHHIEVFLDEDGYTALYKEFPWISAGGETEAEALHELSVAYSLAREVNGAQNV